VESRRLIRSLTDFLDGQKAENIRTIPLENHIAEAFLLASAESIRHLHSLADHLLEHAASIGVKPHHVEGHGTAGSSRWVLVDFRSVVVHLFTEEGRLFYSLDRLLDDRPPESAGTP